MAKHKKSVTPSKTPHKGSGSSGPAIISWLLGLAWPRRWVEVLVGANDGLTWRLVGRREVRLLAPDERRLVIERGEQVHDAGDQAGPAGLVVRPQPGAVVAVEVLVEREVVAPVRIVLKRARAAVHGALALGVA